MIDFGDGGGGISPPLGIPKLQHQHYTADTPINFARENSATFLKDEVFPRNHPPSKPPPSSCMGEVVWSRRLLSTPKGGEGSSGALASPS